MGQPLVYFAVAVGAPYGPKARELERRLLPELPAGWGEVIVAGLLTKLWEIAAARGEDDGSMPAWSSSRLAAALGWGGDPDVLLDALLIVGWIEQPDQEVRRCHDWEEHQPAVRERLRKRAGISGRPPEAPAKTDSIGSIGRRDQKDPPQPPRDGGAKGPKGPPRTGGRRGSPARQAFEALVKAAASRGQRNPPPLSDAEREALRAAGGWSALCASQPKDHGRLRALFVATYDARAGPGETLQPEARS